jgi:hypothetical protein
MFFVRSQTIEMMGPQQEQVNMAAPGSRRDNSACLSASNNEYDEVL